MSLDKIFDELTQRMLELDEERKQQETKPLRKVEFYRHERWLSEKTWYLCQRGNLKPFIRIELDDGSGWDFTFIEFMKFHRGSSTDALLNLIETLVPEEA